MTGESRANGPDDATAAMPSAGGTDPEPPGTPPDPDATRASPVPSAGDADATQIAAGDPPTEVSAGAGAGPAGVAAGAGDIEPPTQEIAAADRTQALSAGDAATRAVPPLRSAADNTVVLSQGDVPPYRRSTNDPTAVQPPVPEGWKGQASVRPAAADPEAERFSPLPPPPNRAWWLPILIGIVGLVLILGIVYALVVATRAPQTPAPAATPSTPASSAPAPSAPVSAPQSPPSGAPSAPPSGLILIPAVLTGGIDLSAAEQTLVSIGLAYAPVPVQDGQRTPGTVIGVVPSVGDLVAPGTVVTIFYAVAPSPAPSPPPSAPPSPPPSVPPSGAHSS